MPQLNGVIGRIFAFIKEGELDMLLNEKLNNTYQKRLWEEAVHMCKTCIAVWIKQAVRRACSKVSMEKNPRSLVRSQSLDILRTSRREEILRYRWKKKRTRKLWMDTLKTIQETHTS